MLRKFRSCNSSGLKRKPPLGIPAAFLILLLIACAGTGRAQVLYGTITGNVTDQSGAVVPAASVQILNLGTGSETPTKTDDHGVFLVTDVLPGTYKITISATGFGTSIHDGVVVLANIVVRVDSTLAVAGKVETITISAAAPVLQTDRGDVHTNLNTTELENLPLNSDEGRNFQILYKTVPGFSTPKTPNSAGGNPQRSMTGYVNGISDQGNTTRVDGATDLYPWLPENIGYVPPADSIESVSIVTNSFDAEQGMAGGAAITIITQSGENGLHGGGFWNTTDQHFIAQNYFTTPGKFSSTNPIPKNIFNEAGGHLGGPIKKNKLFIFGDFETNRQRQFAFKNALIAPAWLRPVVSSQTGVNFTPTGTTIYDPMTCPTTGGDTGCAAFPNDTIPFNRINPAALDYLNLMPTAIASDWAAGGTAPGFDYTNNASAGYTRNDWDLKVTYLPTSKSTFFWRYGYSGSDIVDPPVLGQDGGGATNGGQLGTALGRVQVFAMGGTYTFTPTFLMDGIFGYTRQRLGAIGPDVATGINYGLQFGILNSNGPAALQAGLPSIQTSSWNNQGNDNTGNPFLFRDNQFTGALNFSWQKGAHAIRFGWERDHWGINHFQPQGGTFQTARGTIGFNGDMTSNGAASPNLYNSWADYLLGLDYQNGEAIQINIPNTERESVWSLYIRDQWQVSSKLTVNYGVRWEYYPMMTQARNGAPVFNPATGQVLIGGYNGEPMNDGVGGRAGQLVPRLGLAYRINEKTVLRVGYGVSVDPSNFRNLRNSYPSVVNSSFGNVGVYPVGDPVTGHTPGATSPYSPAGILSAPSGATTFPCTTVAGQTTSYNPGTMCMSYGPWTLPVGLGVAPSLPLASAAGAFLPNNLGTTTVPLNFRRGYIESFNVTLQRELGAGFNAQVAYVRSLAIRQQCNVNINYSLPGGGNTGRVLNQAFAGVFGAGNTTNWSDINSQAPFCTASYNGLQTQLSRHVGSFGMIGVNYTYSQAIGMANGDNNDAGLFYNVPADWYRNRALAGIDQTHNFTLYGVQPTPFGKGEKWLTTGVAGKILGGWQLNEVWTWTSGFPFTVTASGGSLNAAGSSQTANQVVQNVQIYGNHGPSTGSCTVASCQYFNPADFAPVTTATFGSSQRNAFRGPHLFNIDVSLVRTFNLYENFKLQVSATAFSVTNTPHFNNPNSTLGGANFGVITSTLGSSGSGSSSIAGGQRSLWLGVKLLF